MHSPVRRWLLRPDGLSIRLHALRANAGLSGKALARRIGWNQSKVSRLESGSTVPKADDVAAWADACGANSDTTHELLRLLDEVREAQSDWSRRMRLGQVAVQNDYDEMVRTATLLREFESTYVPALLQTAEYARYPLLENVTRHGAAESEVDEAVAARMQRQQYLYNQQKTFEFILAEPVLRWLFCPPEVMAGQLDRLMGVLGLPNVRLGIVPMGVRLHIAPQNSFGIYDDVAMAETFIGEAVHQDEEAVAYSRVMDQLWHDAVGGEGARRLILRAIDLLRGGK